MKNQKFKKTVKIFLDVLLYAFLAACICCVFLTLFSKRDSDGTVQLMNYQMRVVTSESMAKCDLTDVSDFEIKDIPLRSMVFVQVVPKDADEADKWYRNLKVGDVLTFRYVYTTQVTITHRIISITENETGGFVIELAGDNKNADNGQMVQEIDTSIPNNTNYVIGKVVGQSYLFGVIMSFLKQPAAIILVIILPCLVIMILEIFKIFKVINQEKKSKAKEELDKKENELDELRRRLAELENEKNKQSTPDEVETAKESDSGEGDIS